MNVCARQLPLAIALRLAFTLSESDVQSIPQIPVERPQNLNFIYDLEYYTLCKYMDIKLKNYFGR